MNSIIRTLAVAVPLATAALTMLPGAAQASDAGTTYASTVVVDPCPTPGGPRRGDDCTPPGGGDEPTVPGDEPGQPGDGGGDGGNKDADAYEGTDNADAGAGRRWWH